MKLGLITPASNADYDVQINKAKEQLQGVALVVAEKDFSLDTMERERIDVVIASNPSKEWCYLLRGLGVVTTVFGPREEYYDLADIVIDYKCVEGDHYFTGASVDFTRQSPASFAEVVELVKKLDWDSQFFGVNVAYVSCLHLSENINKAISRYVVSNDIHLIEYLCNCHDRRSVLIAEREGFNFVDIRLTFSRALTGLKPLAPDVGLAFRKAGESDIKKLELMAEDMYAKSRYFFDDNFGAGKAREFYRSWIGKAARGQFDDECWCMAEDDLIGAFCSIRYAQGSTATIGLLGVDKAFAGRGIGRQMVARVMEMLAAKGITELSVVTQGRNYAAQNLYQSAGFRTKETQLWYHKWR